MRYWPLVCIIFLQFFASCSKPGQDRWRIGDFGTTDPDKLLLYSMQTGEDLVRNRIRNYLAAKVPESAAGLVARQSLEWYDSDQGTEAYAKRIASLQRCVDANPKYAPCLFLLSTFGADLSGGEESSAQLLQRTLDLDPHFFSHYAFIELHQKLLHVLKDPHRAELLAEKYKQTFPDSYAWDYDKSLSACDERHFDECLAFLNAAKTKSDAPFWVWRDIARLKTEQLYTPGKDPPPIKVAQLVIEDALANRNLSEFEKREAIEWFIHHFGLSPRVADMDFHALCYELAESHHAQNTFEYTQLILSDLRSDRAMEKAAKAIPADPAKSLPSERLALGVAHLTLEGISDRARQLMLSGIVDQYADVDRQGALNVATARLIQMGLAADAEKLLLDVRKEYPAVREAAKGDFDVYMANQDVKEAAGAVKKYPAQNQYFRTDFERWLRMSQALQSRQKFAKDRAFLVNWYKTFSEQPEIAVSFASGSADLPASASSDLDRPAKLMASPEAAPYLFELSGHTDNQEDTAGTPGLSEQRATNVRAVLIQKGVPAERLLIKGYAAQAPRAANQNEQGRQVNRRVEIRPVDNAATARIAEKLPLLNSDVMLPLSGGRWAVMGKYPAYRVDLLNGTRVTSFAEGTPVALLHHERLLLTQFTRNVADGSTRSGLAIYDLLTGEMVARRELISCAPCSQVTVSPEHDEIAYVEGLTLVILDGDTLAIKRQGVVGREVARWSKGIVWSADNKIVVSFANYDRMYVVDAASLKVEHELTGVSWVHSLVLSGTGRYLAAGDGDGKVHVWDAKTWSEHGAVNSGSQYPNVLLARSGSDEIAVGGDAAAARRIDLASLDVLETWPNGEALPNDLGMRGLAYSKDGGIAYRRDKSGWHAEDLATGVSRDLATEMQRDRIVRSQGFTASNRLLVESMYQGNSRLEIFNVKEFSREYDLTPYIPRGATYIAYPDGNLHILDPAAGKWLTFDINTLSFLDSPQSINPALLGKLRSPAKDTDTRVVMTPATLVALTHGRKPGAAETTLHGTIYNRSGESQHTFDLRLVTASLRLGAYDTDFTESVSDSGRYLAVLPQWQDGETSAVKSTHVYVIDTQTGQYVSTEGGTGSPLDIEFSGEVLKVKYGFGERLFDLANRKESRADYGDESTLDLRDGGRLIYRDRGNFYVQHAARLDGFRDTSDQLTQSVDYFPDLGLMVDVADGLLEFRDAKTLTVEFKYSLRAPGEWIAYTEDGHFVASPNGTEGLYWNVGENYLPFEALRQRFEDTNLLRQTKSSSASAANSQTPDATQVTEVQHAALVVESDVFSPPYSVRIAGDAERTTTEATEQLAITVTKTYQTSLPYQLQITLNGRILDAETAARGLARIDAACDDAAAANCASQHVFTAELQEGLNVIEACVNFRNVCVDPHSVSIRKVKGAAAGSNPDSKPRLYFFGVGVSDYADPSLSLQYPRADVRGIAAAFKAQESRMFSVVPVMVLEDSHATAQAVRVAMHDFLREATEQDIVVVYLAGHGAMEDQQLYFITYDAKRDDPYSGLEVTAVKNLLSKRPPGQKAIVILDICHAGAADAIPTRSIRAGSDEAIRLLATGTGTAVLMASTGLELSQEGAQFGGGHGAFSWALMEGLNGAAARDGYVTVTGLEQYVERRVQDITGNHQHPTTSTDKFHDYPVAVSP